MNRFCRLLATPAIAGVFVCAALGGCATPQVTHIQTLSTAEIAHSAGPLNTPFIAQTDYECGPAALAMVMQAAGLAVTVDVLTSQVYLPGRLGSLQVEMLSATRRHGLLPYRLKPRLQDVLQEVAAGNPVIVFQNLAFPIYPVWHYAVVIGYDLERNTIVLHSGRTERMEMSLFTFERTWARAGYWAMVAMQPTSLPASTDPDDLALAVAALEPVNPAAAHTAYETARARWPKRRAFLLGRGNSSYAQRNLARALAEYREAVTIDPEFADGWNNLAQVLLEQGNRKEGLDAIQRAIRIGGPRLAIYEDLSREFDVQ